MFAARALVVCVLFSPHRPAGRRVAACLTAHCACPRRLPWLLDVGGGEGLRQGRRDPSGNLGRAGREKSKVTAWWSSNFHLMCTNLQNIHTLCLLTKFQTVGTNWRIRGSTSGSRRTTFARECPAQTDRCGPTSYRIICTGSARFS